MHFLWIKGLVASLSLPLRSEDVLDVVCQHMVESKTIACGNFKSQPMEIMLKSIRRDAKLYNPKTQCPYTQVEKGHILLVNS